MKSYLYDTSVIIAGILKNHSHHRFAYPWLYASQKKKGSAFVSSHTLAELYSVLTRLPIQPALSPEFVSTFLHKEILDNFSVIDLSTKDYRWAVKRVSQKKLRGGIIYDALHVQACLKKQLHGIVSLNDKDFLRLIETKERIEVINPLLQSYGQPSS